MGDRNFDGVSDYLDDMPIGTNDGYTMLDRNNDGKTDWQDADDRRGYFSTMGWVARCSQPLSAYTEERMRSGHRMYNAGRWNDQANARRPDTSSTVHWLNRKCADTNLLGPQMPPGGRAPKPLTSYSPRRQINYDTIPTMTPLSNVCSPRSSADGWTLMAHAPPTPRSYVGKTPTQRGGVAEVRPTARSPRQVLMARPAQRLMLPDRRLDTIPNLQRLQLNSARGLCFESQRLP